MPTLNPAEGAPGPEPPRDIGEIKEGETYWIDQETGVEFRAEKGGLTLYDQEGKDIIMLAAAPSESDQRPPLQRLLEPRINEEDPMFITTKTFMQLEDSFDQVVALAHCIRAMGNLGDEIEKRTHARPNPYIPIHILDDEEAGIIARAYEVASNPNGLF